MGFWWRPLSVLASVLLVALMLWAGSGWVAALGFLAGIQALVMLRRLWQEYRLARWLENPDEVIPPDATGTWGDIFYRLDKLQRRQKASRSELTNALEQFEHAAQAVPDGMVILNSSDQIDWCNPASRKYMGLDCERDRGQFIRYLLRQAHFLEFLDAADYSRRLVCKSPINREITLSLQLVPFGEGKKLLVARDITDLERVDAMRRDFIANVSHELRTPLTVVGGFVETLADAPGLPVTETRRYFDLMLDHTRRMQHLLDDLLTLSRLESADHSLKDEAVNVPELARALAAEAESLSRGRHRVQPGTRQRRLAERQSAGNPQRPRQPGIQRRALHPGRRRHHPGLARARRRRGVRGDRHRRRHRRRTHSAPDRAVLPGGPQPLARNRRHRARPRHRQACPHPPRRAPGDPVDPGQGQHLFRDLSCPAPEHATARQALP